MEKTNPPRTDEVGRLDEVERLALAERERRIDEAVERGEVVRVPLNVVCAAEDDLEEARVRARVDKVSELRRAGEQRKPAFDEQVILTGVGRPGRDDRYAEKLQAENAQQTIEQRQQEEAEAAKRVEAFHKGARDHAPQPDVPPMPVSAAIEPSRDATWHGFVVSISPPTSGNPGGTAAEGKYAVEANTLFVQDAAGGLVGSRVLAPGQDARTIAKALLYDKKRGGKFWQPIDYPRDRRI